MLYFCRSPVCSEQHLLSFLCFPTILIPTIIFMGRQYQCQGHSLVITSGTAAESASNCWVGLENSPGAAFKASVSGLVVWVFSWTSAALWEKFLLLFCCFVGKGLNSGWACFIFFLPCCSHEITLCFQIFKFCCLAKATSETCSHCVAPALLPVASVRLRAVTFDWEIRKHVSPLGMLFFLAWAWVLSCLTMYAVLVSVV